MQRINRKVPVRDQNTVLVDGSDQTNQIGRGRQHLVLVSCFDEIHSAVARCLSQCLGKSEDKTVIYAEKWPVKQNLVRGRWALAS